MTHESEFPQRIRIAAVQMTSSADRLANLRQMRADLETACEHGAELIAFPENCTLMMEGQKRMLEEAEALDGPSVMMLRQWAREFGVWLQVGGIHLRSETVPDHVTNTSLLIDDSGTVVARYDKIHLFDVDLKDDRAYRESEVVTAGSQPVAIETPFGTIGLSICYDIRFPELYRELSRQGAEIIFIPAAFTVPTGTAHWDVLTRARAVENQCFVVAAAQVGRHDGGRETYGHTRVVDPWGRVLAERGGPEDGPGIIITELDAAVLERVRLELPALEHRRLST